MSARKMTGMAGMAVAAILLLAAGMAQANITIETVIVGNAGNAADTRHVTPGYGAVSYEYNIGKYEVTAGQYTAFLNAVGGLDTYGLYNTNMSNTTSGAGIARSGGGTVDSPYTYSVASDFVNRPVNYVSWGDSVRFVNWLTNGQPTGPQGPLTTENGAYSLNEALTNAQLLAVVAPSAAQRDTWSHSAKPYFLLPSEDEWYKAAYYKGGGTDAGYWEYPTGSDTKPEADLADASGNNANYRAAGSPYPIDSPYFLTVVGQFQNSDSPYGTFDQAGNVWEWNESVIDSSYRGVRGGSYLYGSSGFYMSASFANGFTHTPTSETNGQGFRIVQIPEPASMAVLALGSLGMLLRRRKLGR